VNRETTELEQMRAMLKRIGVEYTERPAQDWERHWRDWEAAKKDWERQWGRPWEERHETDAVERAAGALDVLKVEIHVNPGWVSLHPEIGYIDTELVYDPDGNLVHFLQNE
jgi:hypothetical protein